MFTEITSAFADLLAPLVCIECRRTIVTPQAPLCTTCNDRLSWWRRLDGCPRCGSRHSDSAACPGCYSGGSPLHQCHALLRYQGRVRDWIPQFKHRHSPFGPGLESRIAIEFLSEELARRLASRRAARPELIAPIALHPRRRRQRGFNHSDLIARSIGDLLDIPVAIDALARRRHTPPQARLRYKDRRANLRGAFRTRISMRGVERIWLVDDVLTTGATLDAAGEACLEAGVDEVHALTIAATPPRLHTQ